MFLIKNTSDEKNFQIMQNIEISKATIIDKLSRRLLKDGAEVTVKPISEMWNLLATHEMFPNSCKLAKLKPSFKKSKKVVLSNYRLISLLPLISKTIE